jgi:hypothetical protein
VEDNVTNANVSTPAEFKVDESAPNITDDYVYNNTWVNSDQNVTLTPADTGDSGIKNVTYCTNSTGDSCTPITPLESPYQLSFTGSQNTTVMYQTWDNATSNSSIGSFVVLIDETAPVANVSGAPLDWQKTNVTAEATCSDSTGSGCNVSSYRLNVSTTEVTSCPTGVGNYTLEGPQNISQHSWVCSYVEDNVSNANVSTTAVEFKVDEIIPTCSVTSITALSGAEYVSGTTVYYNPSGSINGTFKVFVDSTDSGGSGMNNVTFPATVSGEESVSSLPYAKSYDWDASDSANYVGATVTCYDNASNANTSTFSVIKDTTAPTITSVTLNASTVKQGASINVTSDAVDAGSGIASCYAYLSNDTSYDVGDVDLGNLETDCNGSVTIPNPTNGSTYYIIVRPVDNLGFANTSSVALTVSAKLAIDLGSAESFVILSKTGITDVPTSDITGDVGASPITGAAIGLTCTEVSGTIYSVDADGPLPCRVTNASLLTAAVNDMEAAYTDAAGRVLPDYTEYEGGNIGGKTLAPGIYKWATSVIIPSDVTLVGNSTDVWIFQIAGTLDISAGKQVILSGGAQEANIFWQVAGRTTLGTTSVFKGNILDQTGIDLRTGATLCGRAFAQTDVTLQSNVISATCGATSPSVALTYSANPAKAGTVTITANYSRAVTSAPNVTVNQSGSIDVTAPMTNITSDNTIWAYNYTVNAATGDTYIDGVANVSLSSVNDTAGNAADVPTNANFTIDTTAPTGYSVNVTGVTHTTGWLAGTVTITCIGATDALSGVNTTGYNYESSLDGLDWTTLSACNTSSCSWDTSELNDVISWVRCRANDNVSNAGEWRNKSYAGIDNTAPVTTVTVGDPNYNSSTLYVTSATQFTLNATDNNASGVNQTQYWFDTDIDTWIDYTNYSGAFNASSAGEGDAILYYRSKDNVSNMESTKSLSIFVDDTGPTGSIIINDEQPYTSSVSVSLALTYADAGAGVNQTRYSNDNLTWSDWEAASATKAWTLTSGDGLKTVYYEVQDKLGNVAQFTDTITLYTPVSTTTLAPTTTIAPTTTTMSTTTTIASSTTSSSTTTTLANGTCVMPGNTAPCNAVTLSEVVLAINEWSAGNLTLANVIDLINSWADVATYPAD